MVTLPGAATVRQPVRPPKPQRIPPRYQMWVANRPRLGATLAAGLMIVATGIVWLWPSWASCGIGAWLVWCTYQQLNDIRDSMLWGYGRHEDRWPLFVVANLLAPMLFTVILIAFP